MVRKKASKRGLTENKPDGHKASVVGAVGRRNVGVPVEKYDPVEVDDPRRRVLDFQKEEPKINKLKTGGRVGRDDETDSS